MTTLRVRKPPFTFGSNETPFLWQPNNPEFSQLCNAVTFVAPAFERYLVVLIQRAAPLLAGTAVAEEAQEFLRQEAQHARMHRRHAAALVAQYPRLADTQRRVDAAYAALLAQKSLDFNLAYMTDIESTFTPFFGMMLDNEGVLFRGGHDTVASLFLWHSMEEIEHRSSAHRIYETAVGRPWLRLMLAPKIFRHITGVVRDIMKDFRQYVPIAERGTDVDAMGFGSQAFHVIPRRQMMAMLSRLALSQLPFHDPDRQPIPHFTAEWYERESRGDDLTRWYAS